ncbi:MULTISPECIES: hypothetical protein [Photobacterium]|uniref:hypothetical protein n=1 Tax=Photobacterium TaxID=657 RepID=UPI001E5F1F01|nr:MULTISPECIES: hypothetical protein [Photobacterium]MCD9468845.1 hypothetical protein [Photobacterium iliopiscarium]MEC6883822.1 hypothetical protein [Photobacterium piscicola]
MSISKKIVSDKRVRISSELEQKILSLANTTKFNDALPVLEQAINMYKLLKEAQDAGSKFYEVDPSGDKYIVKFI